MEAATARAGKTPAWLLGLVPLVLIVAAVGAFALLDGPGLGERNGVPVEELSVERTVLEPGAIGLMALLGLYVGVIPVALGMLWLPWIRRIPRGWLQVVMAVTIGLLAFLAIDATLEGFE